MLQIRGRQPRWAPPCQLISLRHDDVTVRVQGLITHWQAGKRTRILHIIYAEQNSAFRRSLLEIIENVFISCRSRSWNRDLYFYYITWRRHNWSFSLKLEKASAQDLHGNQLGIILLTSVRSLLVKIKIKLDQQVQSTFFSPLNCPCDQIQNVSINLVHPI